MVLHFQQYTENCFIPHFSSPPVPIQLDSYNEIPSIVFNITNSFMLRSHPVKDTLMEPISWLTNFLYIHAVHLNG